GSRIGTLVIWVLPPSLRPGFWAASAGGSRGPCPPAGRRSGRCHREPDPGPHPCTDLGNCCCDLRNVAGAQEEVVLSLGQRAELEVEAAGAGPLEEMLG